MQKSNVSEGKLYKFKTHDNELLMPREEAESMEVFVAVIEPGKSTPQHAHDDAEQLYHVISGTGGVELDYRDGRKATLDLAAGDVLFVSRNTLHQVFCTSDEPLRYLCVDTFPHGIVESESTWDTHCAAIVARLAAQ